MNEKPLAPLPEPIRQLQEQLNQFRLTHARRSKLPLATQVATGDLWLLDVARGVSQRFTFGPFSAYSPVWSPDSTAAAFTAFPEDRMYTKSVDAAKEEAWKVMGTDTYVSSWSAKAKLLVFSQRTSTTKDDLWLLPLGGDRKPRIFKQTPYNERSGQISPDGRWMVYSSDPSGRLVVYIESVARRAAPSARYPSMAASAHIGARMAVNYTSSPAE